MHFDQSYARRTRYQIGDTSFPFVFFGFGEVGPSAQFFIARLQVKGYEQCIRFNNHCLPAGMGECFCVPARISSGRNISSMSMQFCSSPRMEDSSSMAKLQSVGSQPYPRMILLRDVIRSCLLLRVKSSFLTRISMAQWGSPFPEAAEFLRSWREKLLLRGRWVLEWKCLGWRLFLEEGEGQSSWLLGWFWVVLMRQVSQERTFRASLKISVRVPRIFLGEQELVLGSFLRQSLGSNRKCLIYFLANLARILQNLALQSSPSWLDLVLMDFLVSMGASCEIISNDYIKHITFRYLNRFRQINQRF